MPSPYPAHWEADVVLSDGRTVHLRPIGPGDAERLVAFYAEVSDQSKYFRFFAPHPRLSEREVARFTRVDHDARVAIIALDAGEMVGVARYDRLDEGGRRATVAEVAFLVQDAHQGRGLGSVLLEHLAAAARERGVRRFVAEVLPANARMLGVFADAGYSVTTTFEDGVAVLAFDLAETETSQAVRQAREHRAEARSIQRLLHPRSVAVVGAGPRAHAVLRNLLAAGFPGPVHAVRPTAGGHAGAYASLGEVPGPVDLVVVAVPAGEVAGVVAEAGERAAHGLVVVSSGFAETGEEGRGLQRELVHLARAHGMRVVGPDSFGLIRTDPSGPLNASLSPVVPQAGRLGFFSQSGALGVAILESVVRRGLGLSTFVSAGNRADVSGNDLLQYWEEDPRTAAVLLYLESIGNPRKFSRLARRVGRVKPVVAVKSGRFTQGVPLGHSVRASRAPAAAVDAMFAQAGVIRVDTVDHLLDVAQLLVHQPLPGGGRVAVVGSGALGLLASDAAAEAGLSVVGEVVCLGPDAGAAPLRAALAAALEDPAVDAVVVVHTPPPVAPAPEAGVADAAALDVAAVVTEAARRGVKPVVSAALGARGLDPASAAAAAPGKAAVPSYPTPEDAVRALAAVTAYAQWRRRPAGSVPELAVDTAAARRIVGAALSGDGQGGGGVRLPGGEVDPGAEATAALLGCYGIGVWPARPVQSASEAARAAGGLGYPVALKTTLEHLRHRPELGQVRLGLEDEAALRRAWAAMVDQLGPAAGEHAVVQAMAPPGVAVVVASAEDPLFGPVVSFGLGGLATELLGDRAYGIPPLTDSDAEAMISSVRAAPLLSGYRGAEPADLAAVADLLLRVARLADDLPEVASLELNPVLAAARGVSVLGATLALAPPLVRTDRGARALSQ